MALSKMNKIEWESLLIPEDLSEKEIKEHSEMVSEYLSKQAFDGSVDLSSIDKVVEIKIDDSLLETEEMEVEKIANDDLFTYLQEDNIEVNSNLLFPRIKRINKLFWLLNNLGQLDVKGVKIKIQNFEELSIQGHFLIEAALFFGFLKKAKNEEEVYLVPTSLFEDFMKATPDLQYPIFLASLGRNETISEVLRIQLNDPIYDSISRRMVHNILVKDPNIKAESLSTDEITVIINNFRYWYLNIRSVMLES